MEGLGKDSALKEQGKEKDFHSNAICEVESKEHFIVSVFALLPR